MAISQVGITSDPVVQMALLDAAQSESDTRSAKGEIKAAHTEEEHAREAAHEAQRRAEEAAEKAREEHGSSSLWGKVSKAAGAVAGVAAVASLIPGVNAAAIPVMVAAGVVAGGAKIGEGVYAHRAATKDHDAAEAEADATQDRQHAESTKLDGDRGVEHLRTALQAEETDQSMATTAIREQHESRAVLIAHIGGA